MQRVESIYVERLDRAVAAIESRMPSLAPPSRPDTTTASGPTDGR